jgi:antitoxin ParD1/3/4
MSQNTSISLDDHFADFLSREVSSGRYRSASEVVRAGLRLLEDQETQLAALRAALVAGENSGAPEPFDFDVFVASKMS